MSAAHVTPVAVRVFAPPGDDAEAPPGRAVVIVLRGAEAREADVAALLARLSGDGMRLCRIVLIGDGAPPDGFVGADLAALERTDAPVAVYVHGREPGAADPGLPAALLLMLGDLPIEDTACFALSGETWPYARAPGGGLRTLFIFPGPVYPVTLGSHRRALTMLSALVARGADVHILYTGPTTAARQRAAPFLRLFAVEVASHGNKRDLAASVPYAIRRWLYDAARRVWGQKSARAETFGERIRLRDNRSLRSALDRRDLESFDLIVVNYAWMARSLVGRRRPRRPLLVCETHDVQFYRATRNQRVEPVDRLFFPPDRDEREELRVLGAMDYVLAISERDAEILRSRLPAERVLVAASSFDYCRVALDERPAYAPLRFGFIGHRMEANAAALRLVLESWWPVVRAYSPESRLRIAGTICEHPDCRRLSFLDDSVRLLGVVPSLARFYRDIDVLLSPVLVAGGMNYKNAEAIAAGVAVVTTALGAEAVAISDAVLVAETPDALAALLRAIETDEAAERQRRKRAQHELMRRFQPFDAIETLERAAEARGRA